MNYIRVVAYYQDKFKWLYNLLRKNDMSKNTEKAKMANHMKSYAELRTYLKTKAVKGGVYEGRI